MDKQVIIIIGLPGSGKTTFSKQLKDYLIFDDFITKYYDGKVISALKLSQKICLIDPRLCIFNIFIKYITEIEKYVDKKDIHLILFENEPINCLNNTQNSNKSGLQNTINNYSKKYCLNNYDKWQFSILSVWH